MPLSTSINKSMSESLYDDSRPLPKSPVINFNLIVIQYLHVIMIHMF